MPLGTGPIEVHTPFAAPPMDHIPGLPRYFPGGLDHKLRREVPTPMSNVRARTPTTTFRPRTAQARLSGPPPQQHLQLGGHTAIRSNSGFRGWDDRSGGEAQGVTQVDKTTAEISVEMDRAIPRPSATDVGQSSHLAGNADLDSEDEQVFESGGGTQQGQRPESEARQDRQSFGSATEVGTKGQSPTIRHGAAGQLLRRPPSAPACHGARRPPCNTLNACISGAPLNAARASNPRYRASFAINGKFGAAGVRPASAATSPKLAAQRAPSRPSSAGTAAARRSSSAGAVVREDYQGGLLAGRYRTGRLLGKGASACVWEGVHGSSGHRLALKAFEKGGSGWSTRQRQAVREAKLLEMLQHDRIIRTLENFETTMHFYIVCELVDGGSLRQMLRRQPMNRFNEETSKRVFAQVCEGLSFCHSKHVCHRDIKLENVLLDRETNSVKIIDFGFACQVKNHDVKLRVFCGTPSYMAPEMVSGLEYSGFMTDVWSLGVMLFVLLAGRFPFAADSEAQLYARIKRGKFRCPDVIGDEPRQIIGAALRMDSRGRMQVDQMLEHPWISSTSIRSSER